MFHMKKLLFLATLLATACSLSAPVSDDTLNTIQLDPEDGMGFTGTFVVTGFAQVNPVPEPFCESDCDTYDYITFFIQDANTDVIKQVAEENMGNSFIAPSALGLGCEVDGLVYFENNSDLTGWTQSTLDEATSTAILSSTKEAPVDLVLHRERLSFGSGAPACYSHLTTIELLNK